MTMTYWQCRDCHGTGKQIIAGRIYDCGPCDGTGNSLVDGDAERLKRAIAEVQRGLFCAEQHPTKKE